MNGDSALMNNEEPCAAYSFKCLPSQWHIGCLSWCRSTQDFWSYGDPFILGYISLDHSSVLMDHVISYSLLYIHPHGAVPMFPPQKSKNRFIWVACHSPYICFNQTVDDVLDKIMTLALWFSNDLPAWGEEKCDLSSWAYINSCHVFLTLYSLV